jgi:hypothetical protein
MSNNIIKGSTENSPRSLEKALPNGTVLAAEPYNDPDYPGVTIYLRTLAGIDELLCFVEYNTSKPPGRELCIGAYSRGQDDPSYYASYNDPGFPSANN